MSHNTISKKHTGFGVKWKWDKASNFKHSFLNNKLAWKGKQKSEGITNLVKMLTKLLTFNENNKKTTETRTTNFSSHYIIIEYTD